MPRMPGAVWDPITSSAGSFRSGSKRKGVLHTTEGTSYSGARAAYARYGVPPHFTVSWEGGKTVWRQHYDTDVAAKALQNLSGGTETNKEGVIQVEIVAFSDADLARRYNGLHVSMLPDGYLTGIAVGMRWIEANAGVQQYAVEEFKPYPSSYGNNGVRLTVAKFQAATGWMGHQHVPENTHGDPGNLPIARLIGSAPEEDEEMVGLAKVQGTAHLYAIWPSTDGFVREHIQTAEKFWMLTKAGVIKPGQTAAELVGAEAEALVALREV